MDTRLVDRIYESCFAPDVWPEVLDEIGRIAGAPGASLFVSQGAALNWVSSPEPRQRVEKIAAEGWLFRGTIVGRLLALRHPGFLIDVEYFTPEELEREPIYRDVWRPMGVGWGMATAIPMMPISRNARRMSPTSSIFRSSLGRSSASRTLRNRRSATPCSCPARRRRWRPSRS
jgi:hypothetical protein